MQRLKHQNDRSKFNHNISQNFSVQGVAENPKKIKVEKLLPTTQKVNEMFHISTEKPNIIELKRLHEFDEKKVKPRSLLITLSSEH